jgi:hypothetical protein
MRTGEGTSRLHGDARLLSHLAALGRMTAEDGGRGRARLEAELGPETATQLVRTLSRRLASSRPQAPLAFS